MAEVEDLARAAWEGTRSEHAVPYDELEPAYRDNLIRRAEAVLGGAPPTGPWEVYEKQVCELASTNTLAMAAEIPEEVKEELVEEVKEEVKPKPKKAAKKVALKPPLKKPVKVVKAAAKPVAKKK